MASSTTRSTSRTVVLTTIVFTLLLCFFDVVQGRKSGGGSSSSGGSSSGSKSFSKAFGKTKTKNKSWGYDNDNDDYYGYTREAAVEPGVILGAIIGVLLCIAAVAAGLYFFCLKPKKEADEAEEDTAVVVGDVEEATKPAESIEGDAAIAEAAVPDLELNNDDNNAKIETAGIVEATTELKKDDEDDDVPIAVPMATVVSVVEPSSSSTAPKPE